MKAYISHKNSLLHRNTVVQCSCSIFFHFGRAVYGNLPPLALLINCLGVALVLHGGLTYFLTTNDRFKHTASSEEHQELLDRSAGDTESKQ